MHTMHASFAQGRGNVTEGRNPWLAEPAEETPHESATPVTNPGRSIRSAGPSMPQSGVQPPPSFQQLPLLVKDRSSELWCLGAHGGSGESSVASLVDGWRAAEHGWPQHRDGSTANVLLTARSNMSGLQAAQNTAKQWASGLVPHVELIGLVIIADAPGRIPRPLRDFAKLVSGGVPRTWTMPWSETLRIEGELPLSAAPQEVRRTVDRVRAFTNRDAESINNRKESR